MSLWLAEPFVQRISLTLLHFLWQGLAVAGLFCLFVYLFNIRRAEVRYLLSLAALVVMLLCPVVTFGVLNQSELAGSMAIRGERVPLGSQTGGEINTDAMITGGAIEGSLALTGGSTTWLSSIHAWMVGLWLVGVILLSLRLVLGFVGLRRLRRSSLPVTAELNQTLSRMGRQLGLRALPILCASCQVGQAVVVGFFKPVILIPASWLTCMSPAMLEAVLAHELAHVRRFDLWVNLLQRMIESLLFYHPAVWWMSRRVRIERELCCDEMAVAATQRRVEYANALEYVARQRQAENWPMLAAGIGGGEMTLLHRVRNILGAGSSGSKVQRSWWPVGVMMLSLVVAGVLAPWSLSSLRADEDAERAERIEEAERDRDRAEAERHERDERDRDVEAEHRRRAEHERDKHEEARHRERMLKETHEMFKQAMELAEAEEFEEAEELIGRILDVRMELLGPHNEHTEAAFRAAVEILKRQGKEDQAHEVARHFEHALHKSEREEEHEELSDEQREKHLEHASRLFDEGHQLAEKGHGEKAADLLRESLEIRLHLLGAVSEQTHESAGALVGLLNDRGRHREADEIQGHIEHLTQAKHRERREHERRGHERGEPDHRDRERAEHEQREHERREHQAREHERRGEHETRDPRRRPAPPEHRRGGPDSERVERMRERAQQMRKMAERRREEMERHMRERRERDGRPGEHRRPSGPPRGGEHRRPQGPPPGGERRGERPAPSRSQHGERPSQGRGGPPRQGSESDQQRRQMMEQMQRMQREIESLRRELQRLKSGREGSREGSRRGGDESRKDEESDQTQSELTAAFYPVLWIVGRN